MIETYWNGELTPCVRGTAIVADSGTFPEYWARHLVGERVRVVRVFPNGHKGGDRPRFDLYDEDGSGWAKVTDGRGAPRTGHRNVDVVVQSFVPDDWDDLLNIVLEGVR